MEKKQLPFVSVSKTGKQLKKLREEKGFSINDIQCMLNVGYGSPINKWESGKILPSVNTLVALAKIYETTIDDILQLEYEYHHILDFYYTEIDMYREAIDKCGYTGFRIKTKIVYPSCSRSSKRNYRSLLYNGDKDPLEVKNDILQLINKIERGEI